MGLKTTEVEIYFNEFLEGEKWREDCTKQEAQSMWLRILRAKPAEPGVLAKGKKKFKTWA